MHDRPSIIEIVSRYTDLKGSGREHLGLCPLHAEKSPSFTVNEEKGLFYCHGCHQGGDVIHFVELMEDTDFKGALSHLGLTDQPKQTRDEIRKRQTVKRASKNLSACALALSERIGTQMRESGDRAYMAKKILRELPGANKELLQGEIKRATREWEILATLEEDLLNPETVVNLWREREALETIVGSGETYTPKEIEEMYLPVNEGYQQQLLSYVKGRTA